jgi:hypothetical protein
LCQSFEGEEGVVSHWRVEKDADFWRSDFEVNVLLKADDVASLELERT